MGTAETKVDELKLLNKDPKGTREKMVAVMEDLTARLALAEASLVDHESRIDKLEKP